ncbi:MAG: hypothetical protein ACRDYW_13020 [Acidimicrobiales bacterium]
MRRPNVLEVAQRGIRAGGRLADGSAARTFLVATVPVCAVYAATASWWSAQSPDTFTNLLTARSVADRGSIYLDEDQMLTELADYGVSIVPTGDGHLVGRYPPAAGLHAVPFFLLVRGETQPVSPDPLTRQPPRPLGEYRVPPTWPGALTSVLLAAGAVGMLALTFRLFTNGATAVGAAYLFGLGTSVWSVAADELWQHTTGIFWIALSGYLVARARAGSGALTYGIATAVRPLNAIIGGAVVVREGLSRRWQHGLLLAAGLAGGLAVVLGTNAVVFGSPSIQGGYRSGDVLSDREGLGALWFPFNYVRGLLHPRYGLLVWSPFLALLLARVHRAWRTAPDWCRGPALGGALYLVVHWTLHRASGGAGFYFYRYPLEPLTAAAPLLVWTYLDQIRSRPRWNAVFGRCVLVAIVGHTIGALALR